MQAEDGIRDLVRSRGLGDVDKRQELLGPTLIAFGTPAQQQRFLPRILDVTELWSQGYSCLLYTSDAADERSSVDLGGRRIIKKKTNTDHNRCCPETAVQIGHPNATGRYSRTDDVSVLV